MNDLLRAIDIYLWIADFLMLSIFFAIWIREKNISSTLIVVGAVVLLDGIGLNYKYMLLSIEDKYYVDIVRFSWYMGFAAIEYMIMYVTYKVHYLTKTPYSFITKMMFLAHCTLGIIQTVRYGERYFFKTDYLKAIYQNGILSINVTTTAMVIIFTIVVVVSKYRIKKGKEGVAWTV